MTREEAIKIVRENMHLSYDKGNTFKALQTLVPELAEWSEDERIRKALVEYFAPPVSFTTVRGIPVQKVRDWLEKQKEENHNGKKWLTPEELHRIEQLRYEAGFDAGVRSEAEKQKGQKPAENSVCPHSLDEAIQLYYSTYGNGKGGFDHISLPKFQDIVEEFVKDYGQKPTEWSNEDENKIKRLAFLVSVAEEKEMISSSESIDLRNLIKSLCPQPKQEWQIKKGDKVSIHCRKDREKDIIAIYDGKVGKVTHVSDKRYPWGHIDVKLDNGCNNSFHEDELEVLDEPHWKPSDEQMSALEECGECKRCVKELREQIKKL